MGHGPMGPGQGPGPWARAGARAPSLGLLFFQKTVIFPKNKFFWKNGSLVARIAKPLAGTKTYNDYLIAMGSLKSDIFIDFYCHFRICQ